MFIIAVALICTPLILIGHFGSKDATDGFGALAFYSLLTLVVSSIGYGIHLLLGLGAAP